MTWKQEVFSFKIYRLHLISLSPWYLNTLCFKNKSNSHTKISSITVRWPIDHNQNLQTDKTLGYTCSVTTTCPPSPSREHSQMALNFKDCMWPRCTMIANEIPTFRINLHSRFVGCWLMKCDSVYRKLGEGEIIKWGRGEKNTKRKYGSISGRWKG